MSRTDVHRPWPVQVADRTNRHLFYRFPVWPHCVELVPIKNFACGCPMCTGHHSRKLARRRTRVALRTQLRAAVKTSRRDRDSIDIDTRRQAAY